ALERYRYLIAIGGILLLLATRVPGLRAPVNGAYLNINLGPFSFQPAELSKICIVIFLASYLREKRELLAVAARRVAGLTIPPLMLFGAFLALLYVATARFSYVVAGIALFFVGALLVQSLIPHIGDRVDIWL